MGYATSPKTRLIASTIASLIALVMFGVWLKNIGVPGIDTLLNIAPIGIVFTVFATVGVVNAFNLIDGLNGLSSYMSISLHYLCHWLHLRWVIFK